MRFGSVLVLASATVWLTGCGSKAPGTVVVYAASSTRETMEQLASEFQARSGVAVRLNFGPSSTLARQIESGAEADLFLSADHNWSGYLAERGLVAESRPLLANRLVVVVPTDSPLAVHQLADLGRLPLRRLALAGPAVPAGRYAREALRSAGIWPQLQERVLDALDVRAALLYVERAEVDAAIVYATDVAGSTKARAASLIPEELHSPIRYPLALLRPAPERPRAVQFYDYLFSDPAGRVFERAGFRLAGAGGVPEAATTGGGAGKGEGR